MLKTGQELKEALDRMRQLYREATVEIPSNMPEIKGIFLGGCVKRGVGSSFRKLAHAHNHKQDEDFGWVCFRSIKRLGAYSLIPNEVGTTLIVIERPSRTLWHEYAHVICPNHGHDDTWRAKMKELGQPLGKRYEKRLH